jgi:hypothetical protein
MYAPAGTLLVAVILNKDDVPYIMPFTTMQRIFVEQKIREMELYSKKITDGLDSANEGDARRKKKLLAHQQQPLLDNKFSKFTEFRRFITVIGLLGETVSPNVHTSKFKMNDMYADEAVSFPVNVLVRGVVPSRDIGFSPSPDMPMSRGTRTYVIIKPVSIDSIQGTMREALNIAHDNFVSTAIELLSDHAEEEKEKEKEKAEEKEKSDDKKRKVKKQKRSSVFDEEKTGFPKRYQTLTMLIPYSSRCGEGPPTTISTTQAWKYAKKGEQPPVRSGSYIQYLTDNQGNLRRNKNGEVAWVLKEATVYELSILTHPAHSTTTMSSSWLAGRNDNDKMVWIPTDIADSTRVGQFMSDYHIMPVLMG